MKRFQACQGDVMVESCAPSAIKGLKPTKPVLALGEATGHHHRFDNETGEKRALGFYKEGDTGEPIAGGGVLAQFIKITDGAPVSLVHEEHGPIAFDPGTYKKIQQVEYSPEEIRRVED